MSYYMRFLSTDDRPIDYRMLRDGLRAARPDYSVTSEGLLTLGSAAVAAVEINTPGDKLFNEDIDELSEIAREHRRAANFPAVAECLNSARTIVAVEVLFGDLGESALEALKPLWSWLFENRRGLLQTDGEGFWRGNSLILRSE